MVIGTALGWDNAPTMVLAIALAFLFGYSFTVYAVRKAGLDLKAAIRIALAADTVSIAVMELVDNLIIALTPGAMDAHLSDGLFWGALLGGFAVAFVITTPLNKWLIGRGKGHAVVYAYHH
jgi:Zn-dependent protease